MTAVTLFAVGNFYS